MCVFKLKTFLGQSSKEQVPKLQGPVSGERLESRTTSHGAASVLGSRTQGDMGGEACGAGDRLGHC